VGILQPALRALAFKRMPEARRGIRRIPPIRLSDAQLSAVFDAAKPLSVASRDAFLLELAAALAGIVDPCDGDVSRAIRAVQRKHFDPPELRAHAVPHRRRQA
jgi:hypothetical protein